MTTEKLEVNSLYEIIGIKDAKTRFGNTHILIDKDLNQYWSTNSISKHINDNKAAINRTPKGKIIFKLRTYDYETFETEDGKSIRYLRCNFN